MWCSHVALVKIGQGLVVGKKQRQEEGNRKGVGKGKSEVESAEEGWRQQGEG
jgi:hypothetical protein